MLLVEHWHLQMLRLLAKIARLSPLFVLRWIQLHFVSLSIAKRPKNYGIVCLIHEHKAAQSVHALQSQFSM